MKKLNNLVVICVLVAIILTMSGFSNRPTKSDSGFTDVKDGAWYFDAVVAMKNGRLINGYGDGTFGPDDYITYAQFCQILSNYKKFTKMDDSDYWGYSAVAQCKEHKYIEDRGDITSGNYDVPMTREAAVSAMVRAVHDSSLEITDTNKFTSNDIPDYNSISSVYADEVLEGYRLGITTGMDSSHTFYPKGTLTRAQVCQLFYNLDWTTVED